MTKVKDRLSPEQVAAARERRLEAMHLQEIEGNPLDAEDIAMFEMFEREGWDHEPPPRVYSGAGSCNRPRQVKNDVDP